MSDLAGKLFTGFDAYSRTARLTPGLLMLVAPAAVAIGAGAAAWPGATLVLSLLVVAGGQLPLAEWVRRKGQGLQRRLWEEWGGDPVTRALREDGPVAARRRGALARATRLPVDDTEDRDFDQAMQAAVRRLIDSTRDPARFSLVQEENRAYGFARNVMAIRTPGLILAGVSLAAGILLVALAAQSGVLSLAGTSVGSGVAALSVVFWWRYPSEARLLAAAVDYRDRLLEALDGGAL
jgi:hypothetical protein